MAGQAAHRAGLGDAHGAVRARLPGLVVRVDALHRLRYAPAHSRQSRQVRGSCAFACEAMDGAFQQCMGFRCVECSAVYAYRCRGIAVARNPQQKSHSDLLLDSLKAACPEDCADRQGAGRSMSHLTSCAPHPEAGACAPRARPGSSPCAPPKAAACFARCASGAPARAAPASAPAPCRPTAGIPGRTARDLPAHSLPLSASLHQHHHHSHPISDITDTSIKASVSMSATHSLPSQSWMQAGA